MTFAELSAAAQEELDIAEEATGQAMVYMVGAVACAVLDAWPRAVWLELIRDPDDDSAVQVGDVIDAMGQVIAAGSDVPDGAAALVSELDIHYRGWREYLRRTSERSSAMRWLDLLRASQIRAVDTGA